MTNANDRFERFVKTSAYLTFDESLEIQREASRLQGQLIAKHVKILGRALWRAVVAVSKAPVWFFDELNRARVGLRVHDELHRMTDRQLEDVGIARHEIGRYVLAAMDAVGSPVEDTVEAKLQSIPGGRAAKKAQPRIDMPRKRAA
jgi:uncharacterized protein YjiS (DUF1127 family)